MNQKEMCAFLRQEKIVDQLSDGPVSMMVRQNGKLVPITVTRKGEWAMVTTGRIFRRRIRLPLAELKK